MTNFCRNYTLEEILDGYKDTSIYPDADTAYNEFVSDYDEELSAQENRELVEGRASCSLNDYYEEHGFKLRFVIEDSHTNYDRDTFMDVVYTDDREAAIEEGKKAWDRLTPYEKKDRRIEVLYGFFDDKGNVDPDRSIGEILWSNEN